METLRLSACFLIGKGNCPSLLLYRIGSASGFPLRETIQHFSCLTISMLDIDGFRFDKATQVIVDAQAEFGDFIRQCAHGLGKTNFFMPGEITGGNTFGSIYLGRGRQPDQAALLKGNITRAATLTNASDESLFLRDQGKNALDAAAFHYSIYRTLTRSLGLMGTQPPGMMCRRPSWIYGTPCLLATNDLVNPNTGEFDPRHMYEVTNQDVFRWPAIKDGTSKMLLGLFITTLHMLGIPLLLCKFRHLSSPIVALYIQHIFLAWYYLVLETSNWTLLSCWKICESRLSDQ